MEFFHTWEEYILKNTVNVLFSDIYILDIHAHIPVEVDCF